MVGDNEMIEDTKNMETHDLPYNAKENDDKKEDAKKVDTFYKNNCKKLKHMSEEEGGKVERKYTPSKKG